MGRIVEKSAPRTVVAQLILMGLAQTSPCLSAHVPPTRLIHWEKLLHRHSLFSIN